ncbi:MAG: restriction endonuclease [Terriglobia bacterium]
MQCKHWRSQKVGVAVIRELRGVMTAQGAGGIRGDIRRVHARGNTIRSDLPD